METESTRVLRNIKHYLERENKANKDNVSLYYEILIYIWIYTYTESTAIKTNIHSVKLIEKTVIKEMWTNNKVDQHTGGNC